MTTISDEYREQQAEFHELRPDYGVRGHRHTDEIVEMALQVGATSILDYGCGKGQLRAAIMEKSGLKRPPLHVVNYDPCVPQWAETPVACDLVVCADVLEHIEPLYLQNTLDDLQVLAKMAVYLVIHTGPAQKMLQDGRNAHLIQEGPRWWLNEMADRWEIKNMLYAPPELYIAGAMS